MDGSKASNEGFYVHKFIEWYQFYSISLPSRYLLLINMAFAVIIIAAPYKPKFLFKWCLLVLQPLLVKYYLNRLLSLKFKYSQYVVKYSHRLERPGYSLRDCISVYGYYWGWLQRKPWKGKSNASKVETKRRKWSNSGNPYKCSCEDWKERRRRKTAWYVISSCKESLDNGLIKIYLLSSRNKRTPM